MLVTQSCPTLLRPHRLAACQAPLSMGFSRQQYWSGLPFPSPSILRDAQKLPEMSRTRSFHRLNFTIQRRHNTHLSQAPPKNLKEHFLTHFTRPKLHWYQIWTRITQNSTDLADWKTGKDRVINYLLMDITECDILWIVNMLFFICSRNTQKKFTLYLAKKTTDYSLIKM